MPSPVGVKTDCGGSEPSGANQLPPLLDGSKIRDVLLDEVHSDPDFGVLRLQDVAELLLAYVERTLPKTRDQETRSFLVAQEWVALAYLEPAVAAQALAAALRHELSGGCGPDVLRVVSLAQALAAPLQSEEKVLLYAAGYEKLAAGQLALGVRLLEAVERALLVIGGPGIGKSAIVAELVHRNPRGQVLAHHCCQRDGLETRQPRPRSGCSPRSRLRLWRRPS